MHHVLRPLETIQIAVEHWQKLERGDYDWAHLAYTLWPDRVREKCRTDRSLAVAHDLEELYVAPPETQKRKRGKQAAGTLLPDYNSDADNEE